MIRIGVDELTIVLKAGKQAMASMSLEDWPDIAEGMIGEFVDATGFEKVYGRRRAEFRCPQGYTQAISFGEHPFYVAIGYHDRMPTMGCCVRMSAHALDYFVEHSGEEAYRLVQKASFPPAYEASLSRIDLTVDYLDEGVDVSSLYMGLASGEILAMREQPDPRTGEIKLRRAAAKLSGYAVGDTVPTLYLGSRKANVDAILRVYDKRREQLETKGRSLPQARSCRDWVRFEASLRHAYARQFGRELLTVSDDEEFAVAIATVFLQRYRFYGAEGPSKWTTILMDAVGSSDFRLRSPSERNSDLFASLAHVCRGSGLMPLLFKARSIWGEDAPTKLLDFIAGLFEFYCSNADCRSWLRKNGRDYRARYPEVDDFLVESCIS